MYVFMYVVYQKVKYKGPKFKFQILSNGKQNCTTNKFKKKIRKILKLLTCQGITHNLNKYNKNCNLCEFSF